MGTRCGTTLCLLPAGAVTAGVSSRVGAPPPSAIQNPNLAQPFRRTHTSAIRIRTAYSTPFPQRDSFARSLPPSSTDHQPPLNTHSPTHSLTH